ncbi:MAG: hypothetical protein COU11_01115 [Candidatus Harrisonbacteria bacterium CG10_big_fil_rev_8_21_14_0_10_49_15]|uniref:SIMPL domain-containing protein n=1 Tax=Candidatus Harrisonbacteria bacterium CG10_big_fil_rev_8_21_14_0_10_49_15 TaxID=1974587 RepID=A0A2H0ULP6_9BACT|nr:MAG: hypothetical protein COU11_01115 [Candidatus Harrisonbacteria bacterium CG10_big_fil_rev_8_21_14_0_10_49_15]
MFKKETMEGMKGIFWMLLNVVMVFVLFLGIIGMTAIARYSNAVVPSRTVTVTGEGEVEVSPDLATLNFSVVTQGKDPDAITKQNTEKMNTVIAFVKEQGIEAKDIKTSNFNLYPRYTYLEREEPSITGYELNQGVTVKIRDLDKVSTIVGGLTSRGINQISSVSYSIDDPEAQRVEARQEAFAEAYEKARVMARQNGVRIARVINFSEGFSGGYPPIMYAKEEAYGRGGDMAMSSAMPNFEAGSEEVKVFVTVTYEIE